MRIKDPLLNVPLSPKEAGAISRQIISLVLSTAAVWMTVNHTPIFSAKFPEFKVISSTASE